MQREHIYRARRKDTGSYIEGFYREQPAPPVCFGESEKPKSYIIFTDPRYLPDWGLPYQMVEVEVIPESVCEYTGMLDKNKVKIFEQDRCRVTRGIYPPVVGSIKFLEGCFCFVEEETKALVELCHLSVNNMEIEVL